MVRRNDARSRWELGLGRLLDVVRTRRKIGVRFVWLRAADGECTVVSVPLSLVLQSICILVLIGLATMLMLVGAYGSGAVCGLAGLGWFWKVYRAVED